MENTNRLSQYYAMVSESRKSQKEFMKKLENDPSIIFAVDANPYQLAKSGRIMAFTYSSVITVGFMLYWLKKINLNEQKGPKLWACVGLMMFLPIYTSKLMYGKTTTTNYEEYLYAKYVLYNSKPK